MFARISVFLISLCVLSVDLSAQRRPEMTVEELTSWRRITRSQISNDGKWAAATIAPWEGDATVRLYDHKGKEQAAYTPAETFNFSNSSQFLIVSLTTPKATLDSLKLAGVKRDRMPMNSLLLRRLGGAVETLDSVRSYRLAEETDLLAWQRGRRDSTLRVRSLDGTDVRQYPAVSEYRFADKSGMIFFVSGGDGKEMAAGLYALDPEHGELQLVKAGRQGHFKQITWNEDGTLLAFLYSEKQDPTYRSTALWLWDGEGARSVARQEEAEFPAGWVVSEHGRLAFSKDSRRLFFGTSPEPRQRDTTRLPESRPEVQVWSWDEPVQYTIQSHNLEEELKRTYTAMYDLTTGRLLQLADRSLPDFTRPAQGDGDVGLLTTRAPYSISDLWKERSACDVWAVSLATGERRLLKQEAYTAPRISPAGKYAYWYEAPERSWRTIDLTTGQEYRITSPETFTAWDELWDKPHAASSYGAAGWTPDDASILLYDRYDIWRFDPTGSAPPVNLTDNGRVKKINYRILELQPDQQTTDLSKPIYLASFDETTKGFGYYRLDPGARRMPKKLLAGDFMLSTPTKAKRSEAVIYTRQNCQEYPELRLSDLSFKKSVQLTHEGEQREGVRWGTVELVRWTSLDGIHLEGLLYKPEGFDPTRKYPLLVNFYERSSEELHAYRLPGPNRSTIDYRLYNSNGYVIFNPDVVYTVGSPGESCYNCVIPGIEMLIAQGFIDTDAIGAQGHSWGGYQVSYLATRTDMFSAIEAGAAVVDLFSAYTGIRWETGRGRPFMYENGQGRIGGNPWNDFRLFHENSPLFALDKVSTPILIMHNDKDGHVPWEQGIEFFVSLKRLRKPAWLLNYTGEVHWPGKMANRIDFQKRMFQFFNHYLRREPMPRWMSEGLPAVEGRFENGYEQ